MNRSVSRGKHQRFLYFEMSRKIDTISLRQPCASPLEPVNCVQSHVWRQRVVLAVSAFIDSPCSAWHDVPEIWRLAKIRLSRLAHQHSQTSLERLKDVRARGNLAFLHRKIPFCVSTREIGHGFLLDRRLPAFFMQLLDSCFRR